MSADPETPLPDEGVDVRDRLTAGRQRFLDLELLCGAGALVPRPETEILGRAALDRLRAEPASELRLVDMCCGAGNLACALAAHLPHARVWASDLTDGCVHWTKANIAHLGLGARVVVAQGDLFAGLDGFGLEGTIDAIVCNPPYISTGRLQTERAALLALEPREAFDGGPYGLSVHQRVFTDAPRFLKPRGRIFMEFGLGQHRQVKVLADRSRRFADVEFVADASGAPRVVIARLHS
ncbi:MAG: class I SAM-dependent methyltransferase [Vicinamibacterales bacterium]